MTGARAARAALLAVCLALPLAACGSGSEPADDADVQATNATVEEVAEQVREASGSEQFIRPGKWVSTLSIEEMTAPGMPAGAAEQMQGMLGQGESFESCLTGDQASRPNEQFFAGANRQCRYENFTMGDGKIEATMRCGGEGAAQVMEMEGSYSPDSYELQMTSVAPAGPGASDDMRMRMRIEARRVGECEPAAAE